MAKADASARAAARHAAAPGTEVELKFRLDPARRAAVERVLGTRTAERVRLRACYFDTPDGRLAAARLALRLRLEGERWVQTLKGQGDDVLRRLEDEVPLPGAAGELRFDLGAARLVIQAAPADGAAPAQNVVFYVTSKHPDGSSA
ncbi:MAG TPA: CYTH domain-containing protein, partial [Rubrivivax sp.]|nr:CYTH domain-containing protein [Rubrivivax sp.]